MVNAIGPTMQSALLVTAIFAPLLAAGALFKVRVFPKAHKLALGAIGIATGAAFVALREPIEIIWEGFLGVKFVLAPDYMGVFLAIMALVLWLFYTLFSLDYMQKSKNPTRFLFFSLLSLTGTLGVFLAGDLFTMFVFFEFMAFASFPLVIHEENAEAQTAGKQYLYIGVLGGLTILLGLFLLYHRLGTLMYSELGAALAAGTGVDWIIIAGMLLGFGIKAGLVPVHFWVPRGYVAAPAPGSAILSAVLKKCGVFGIIRLVFLMAPILTFGQVMLGLGLLTMVLGSLLAFFEHNGKRILAYSSVSQAGYIMVGIGGGAIMAETGAMGGLGSFYHVLNHALFKGSLFLAMGYIFLRTREFNIYRLGNLWRKMPFTTILAVVSAAGLMGLPLFNGYPSKTMIHHAITFAESETQMAIYGYAETVFNIGAAGTTAYCIKLIYNVFFAPRETRFSGDKERPLVQSIFITLTAAMLFIGLAPTLTMESIIFPAAGAFNLDVDFVEYKLGGYNFFNAYDLRGAFNILLMGLGLTLLNLFLVRKKIDLPRWLSIEHLVFNPIIKGLGAVLAGSYYFINNRLMGFGTSLVEGYKRGLPYINNLDGYVDALGKRTDELFSGFVFRYKEQEDKRKLINIILDYGLDKESESDLKGFWDWLTGEGFLKPVDKEDVDSRDFIGSVEDFSKKVQEIMEEEDLSEKEKNRLENLFARLMTLEEKGFARESMEEKRYPHLRIIQRLEEVFQFLTGNIQTVEGLEKEQEKEKGRKKRERETKKKEAADSGWGKWSLLNLNFDMIILAVTLVIAVILLVFFAQI